MSAYYSNGIILGLLITPDSGRMFIKVSAGVGRLDGVEITYSSSVVEVDAPDGSLDRIDAIYITAVGAIYVAGDPSLTPIVKPYPGAETSFLAGYFTVPAGITDSDYFVYSYAAPTIYSNLVDYHLSRDSFNFLNRGVDLVDPYVDVDVDSEKIDGLSIGADTILFVETKDLFFSVGTNAGDLKTGSNLTIKVTDDVITFNEPQTNQYLGVGCVVSFGPNRYYLYEKISNTQWIVKTSLGESVDDVASTSDFSIVYAYNKMSDLFSDIKNIIGQYLRTSKYRLNITCYKGVVADSGDVTIRFFDTNVDNFIRIYTPRDLSWECNSPQIHCDDPNNSNYQLETSKIDLYVPNTVVDGLGFYGVTADAVRLNNCQNVSVMNNLILGMVNGIISESDGHVDPAINENFSHGTIPDLFGIDILSNWSVKEFYDRNIIYRNPDVVPAYEEIFASASYTGDFDFEFSIIHRSSGTVKIAAHAGGPVLAELIYNQASIAFNGTTVKTNHKYGVEYRFRMIRGGTLSSDGIYQTDAGKVNHISLYYFYNNVWNYIDDDYTGIADTCTFIVQSDGAHGIGFVRSWGIADTNIDYDTGSNKNNLIANNIIYSMSEHGIVSSGSDRVYNNTVDECGGNGFFNKVDDDLINNIATRCLNDFFNNENIKNCGSDDDTAGYRNECISFISMEFVDYASMIFLRNYRPKNDAINIRGNGLSLISKFNIDATGWPRDRHWDRGALEYIPNMAYIGISSFNENLKSSGSLTYTIQVFPHYSIMVFSQPQTNEKIAVGCSVEDSSNPFGVGCVLIRKLSPSHWVVCNENGYPINDRASGNVSKIYVKYSGFPYSLETHYQNMVGDRYRLTLVYYNDGNLNVPINFTDYLCDVDHYLRFIAPKDTATECNRSQKHEGVLGDGASIDSISLLECYYAEISGLQVYNEIALVSSGGHFVGYNILKNIGLKMSLYIDNMVMNNLIFDCDGFGIDCGNMTDFADSLYDERNFADISIINNTIASCRQALRFYKPNHKYTATAYVRNNLFQRSEIHNVACEYPNRKGNFFFKDNIMSEQKNMIFVDRVGGNYNLDPYQDYFAVDNASDQSSLFVDDIVGSLREPSMWDIGAFESLDIIGTGELLLGSLDFVGYGTNGGTPLTTILYLRKPGPFGNEEENFLGNVSPDVQFTSIEGTDRYAINHYLSELAASGVMVDNLIIYTQGGITFTGTFTLFDRGSRNVTISTYPDEAVDGPSTLIYVGPVVDDVSKQDWLTFIGVKIFSDPSAVQVRPISDSGNTFKVRFINCVVQMNNTAISAYAAVESINSVLIYRNAANTNTCVLALYEPAVPSKCINSIIISYRNTPYYFLTSPNSGDVVKNTILYNYSGHAFTFLNSTTDCMPSTDPDFEDVVLTEQLFSISGLTVKNFNYNKTSPAHDAGYTQAVSDYSMSIDIIGNPRIYLSGDVDIGPYELQITNVLFESSDLEAVFQDKFSFTGEYFKTKTKVYRDLVIVNRDEFCRESKVVMRLKEARRDHALLSDKPNDVVYQFSAFFDLSTRSIILFKTDRYLGGLLKTIFDDGRYLFYFDDVKNLLTVYLMDTYNKGLSGKNNVINSVKFGGSAVMV